MSSPSGTLKGGRGQGTPDGFGPCSQACDGVADDGSRWRGPGENHGFDAVVQNGSAASELSLRCASLHHGLGPHPPNTRMWHECSCYHTRAPLGLSSSRPQQACRRARTRQGPRPLLVGATRPSLTASVRAGSTRLWVGAKKRLARSNKETLREEKWIGPFGHPLDKNRPIQGFRTPA